MALVQPSKDKMVSESISQKIGLPFWAIQRELLGGETEVCSYMQISRGFVSLCCLSAKGCALKNH